MCHSQFLSFHQFYSMENRRACFYFLAERKEASCEKAVIYNFELIVISWDVEKLQSIRSLARIHKHIFSMLIEKVFLANTKACVEVKKTMSIHHCSHTIDSGIFQFPLLKVTFLCFCNVEKSATSWLVCDSVQLRSFTYCQQQAMKDNLKHSFLFVLRSLCRHMDEQNHA